ncbi:MAG: ABC transporter permease [Alphaproteobacteria bacterium]|nr:ABC transporter permease [Alphaproteobacteria bacterium]
MSAAAATFGEERRRLDPFGRAAVSLFAVPPVVFLILAFVVPLSVVLGAAVFDGDGVSISRYAAFFAQEGNRTMVLNTFVYGVVTALVCAALGFPLGYAIARAGRRMQVTLIVLTFLPLCTSIIVKAFAITLILKSNGPVNSLLLMLGVVDEPVRLIFTRTALFVGSMNAFLPFAVLPVFAVLAERGRDLEEAAASLGCSPAFTLFHVVIPTAFPGIVAGFSIVAAQAISAYVVPTLLIGDRFRVLARGAYDAYVLNDGAGAAVAATILLALSLGVVACANRLSGRAERPA